jgi:hypothetical protein
MPLAFESLSHGTIAFGFFNIETDLLLLERYFFFADFFCINIGNIPVVKRNETYSTTWQVYFIDPVEKIGDLMGAIHGERYIGFIGEVYQRFPFSSNPSEFKQKPQGFRNRAAIEAIVEKYGDLLEIQFKIEKAAQEVVIGDYKFNRSVFLDLIQYVWRGGYPRWKNEEKPAYLKELKNMLDQNADQMFAALNWDQ